MRKMKYGMVLVFNIETCTAEWIRIPKNSRQYKEYWRSHMLACYYCCYNEFPPASFPIKKWYKEYIKYHPEED